MSKSSDVFISYAADTKPLAEQLTTALQDSGIRAWVDFKDLKPGQRFQEELDRATQNAGSFLFLVSKQSRATPWLEAEWRAALIRAWDDSEKRLIPILVGDTEAPSFLRSWVALRVDPAAEPSTWTNRVVDALQSFPSSSSLTPEDLRERNDRLGELRKATEALGKLDLIEPPSWQG